jgi:hypothetical protein
MSDRLALANAIEDAGIAIVVVIPFEHATEAKAAA